MKYIWTEEDIICGRIVCKDRLLKPHITGDLGWHAKWTYKIGFLASGNPARPYSLKDLEKRADYCLIAMTDGMILAPKTKKEMAEHLNGNKMIPCPHNWLV